MDGITAWTLGAQLVAAHFGGGASDMEWATPGLYAMHASGASAGFYRNSQGHGSAWAGWTFETESRTWAISVGAVTGYDKAKVLPLLTPSVRIPVGDYAVRLMFVPPIAKHNIVGAVALAVEMSL